MNKIRLGEGVFTKKKKTHTHFTLVKFGQRLFTTHPHVSDYTLLKTRMGDENSWQTELLQRFGVYTFRELLKGSELTQRTLIAKFERLVERQRCQQPGRNRPDAVGTAQPSAEHVSVLDNIEVTTLVSSDPFNNSLKKVYAPKRRSSLCHLFSSPIRVFNKI